MTKRLSFPNVSIGNPQLGKIKPNGKKMRKIISNFAKKIKDCCSGKAIALLLLCKFFICSLIISTLECGYINALEIKSMSITDSLGNSRSVYSNTEKVNLNVTVNITAVGERVSFRFEVYDPDGNKRFTHTGNSVPGTIGEAGSSIKYVPTINFFSTSGKYKLVIYANTVMKETTFSVYSPNITLTYPSNYAKDLADNPLILRWVASGASKYRVYVDDDAAFFNCLLTEDTIMTQYIYPAEPGDTRQKLSGGTVYYWKVEGIDASGSVVAKTASPFCFTIKSSAITVTAKDIAITDIAVVGSDVVVSVKNQGGKQENSIPVALYLNGTLLKTVSIASISPNEIKKVIFTPSIAGMTIAMATVVFDDDYTKNNVFTKQITITVISEVPVTPPLPEVEEKAKILGSVESADGKKLEEATVDYSGAAEGSVKTNKGGEYKIEGLPLGEYKLKASCSGYENADMTVEVKKAKAYTKNNFELEMKKAEEVAGTASVKGQVKDSAADKGAAGIDIVLMKGSEEFAKFQSDKQGYYRFVDLPAGKYTVVFTGEGYEEVERKIELKDGQEARMDIGLEPAKEEKEKEKETAPEVDYAKDTKKCWEIIGGVIEDKEITAGLEGYALEKVTSGGDVNKIMAAIAQGKAKILGIEVEVK